MSNPNGGMNDLTLEKLKIAERLNALEIRLAEFNTTFKAHTDQDMLVQRRVMDMVKTHQKTLYGSNGTPGLRIDMERVKEKEKGRDRMLWIVVAAVVGLIIHAILRILPIAS